MEAQTSSPRESDRVAFRVIDALDHPHGGRILRVRLQGGSPVPTLRQIRGSRMRAVAPDGSESFVKVLGFPVLGGRVSSRRLEESGRLDLHVEEEPGGTPVSLRWTLQPD